MLGDATDWSEACRWWHVEQRHHRLCCRRRLGRSSADTGEPPPWWRPAVENGTTGSWGPGSCQTVDTFLISKVGDPGLFVASLDVGGMQRVADDGSRAVYAAGHLLFLRGAKLFARPFDAARLVFTGPERLLTAGGLLLRVRQRHRVSTDRSVSRCRG